MAEINIFNERYLKEHPLYNSIHSSYFYKDAKDDSYDNMMGYLKAVISDEDFWKDSKQIKERSLVEVHGGDKEMSNRKVFIVHGHDELAETQVARFVERLGLEAIILHEQPNSGRTIIEKIEANADVGYAIVLYTPCDLGRAKEEDVTKEKTRARQNVVFEHGYLIGKLNRRKVSALVKGGVDTPGDISGVVYIQMDDAGAWKMKLAKEMMSEGIECDLANMLL